MKYSFIKIYQQISFYLLFCLVFISNAYSQNKVITDIKPFSKVYVKDRIVTLLSIDTLNKIVLVPNGGAWLEEVNTKSNGKDLYISTDGKFRDSEVLCYVKYKQPITYLDTQNGGVIRTDSGQVITTPKLEINATIDGFTNIDVNVDELIINAGSGSDIYIKGSAKKVEVYATTGAKIHLEDLECENAEASSILGAKIWLTVKNDYKAKAATGGKIYYYAQPSGKFDRSRITGGDVELIVR